MKSKCASPITIEVIISLVPVHMKKHLDGSVKCVATETMAGVAYTMLLHVVDAFVIQKKCIGRYIYYLLLINALLIIILLLLLFYIGLKHSKIQIMYK